MNDMTLLVIVLVLVFIVALTRRRTPNTRPMADSLHRLHPGVAHKAEWMASEDIVRRVEADYTIAQQWMADALLNNTIDYLNGVSRYFCSEALAEQQRITGLQMNKRGPRLVGVMRAHHHVQVRRFSDDGMLCYLLDHQAERRMATYDYWTKRRLNTQDLGAGSYVYEMQYDSVAARWKIAKLIQQLPLSWGMSTATQSPLRFSDNLPSSAGRDF